MSAVDDLLAAGTGRADARRNVERLVRAARAALDEHGLAVTTREIAQRAGVGLGTLHRRVPSVEALLTAILLDTVHSMAELAERAAAHPDPWTGFVEFAESYVQLRAASCGVNDALAESPPGLEQVVGRVREAARLLVERGQAAGALRADRDFRDVLFLLATAVPPEHTLGVTAREDQWRRTLGVLLDGLRHREVRATQP